MGCLAVLALVVVSAAAASATAASTCDGACYGCRDGTSASCVNASWTGAGSCTTPVGGTIYAAPLPPPHKNVNNTALPGLERTGAPVPDGVYVVPGLDVGSDLAFGPNHMLGFFRATRCSELCLRTGYFNASAANCAAPRAVVDFGDSPIWAIPWIPFDQYMEENSQIYCKDDRVAWIRSNEGLQCLGRPDEASPEAHVCSACPWLAVGFVPAPEAPGCGAGAACAPGRACCRDPTANGSAPLCVVADEGDCATVYSQCCTTDGCPPPFARRCDAA